MNRCAQFAALLTGLVWTIAPAAQLSAQKAGEPPRRPPLLATADTNDAEAYIAAGKQWLKSDPKKALAAGYWAVRLDPWSPNALYFYWQARWSNRIDLFDRVLSGNRKAVESPETRQIDSLLWRAMLRDPFVTYAPANRLLVLGGKYDRRVLLIMPGDSVMMHLFEAGRQYRLARYDSTIARIRSALTISERADAERMRPVYASREMFHFGIGKALFAAGDRNAARNSYGDALLENLAFYPAHAEIGLIAWSNWSDLETARTRYEQALELVNDPMVRYDYATVLLEARQYEDAIAHFDQAIVAEPYYAGAYFNRGLAKDRLGRNGEALADYERFVALAPGRLYETITAAKRRIATIRSAAP